MNISEIKNGNTYTFILDGDLDTSTAPLLEKRLGNITSEITKIIFDFTDLAYISSAGLRTILLANKTLGKSGIVTIKGANPMVKDIFDITGFSDTLDFE